MIQSAFILKLLIEFSIHLFMPSTQRFITYKMVNSNIMIGALKSFINIYLIQI